MKNLFFIFVGGGIGSLLRYGFGFLFIKNKTSFPWATFAVNILGCLLIGLFMGWFLKNDGSSNTAKLLLVTGFCGGFTTFSTFSFEAMQLLKQNQLQYFLLYVMGSLILGFLFTFLGYTFTK